MRKLNVVLWQARHLEADHIIEDYVKRVTEVFGDHNFRLVRGKEPDIADIDKVEVMVCWGISKEMFLDMKSLEWLQFGSAGINHTLFPELLESHVRLTTQKGIFSKPIAEHVLACALHFSRRFDFFLRKQFEGEWARYTQYGPAVNELDGTTVGIIGMGHIGREVAAKFRALGVRTIATRSSGSYEDDADEWVDRGDPEKLLRSSDWVVLNVPQTPETERMIGAEQIGLMKPTSVLINICRGSVVDEPALIDALQNNRIAGAALDVFETEPLPKDSPLWTLPNTLVTSHISGTTPYYGLRGADNIRRNLEAFLAGEKMPTEFDRQKGY